MKAFCFGLGYCALHYVRSRPGIEASGTVREAGKAQALAQEGIAAMVFDGARADPAIAPRLAAAEAIISSIAPAAGDPALMRFAGAIRQARGLRAIVYLSTIGVYGDHGGAWVDERSATATRSERGLARLAAEQAWRALEAGAGAPVHVLRLAGIYGPQRNALVKLRQGEARRIAKPGQRFNRVHVEDIAQAIDRVIAAPGPGGVWNVADEEPAPPQEVIAFAARLLGLAPPPEEAFETAPMTAMARAFYADNKRISIARLKETLGFKPAYPTYREGLTALAAAGEGR
jgi:nucleoside-diphosphate-sugar epimerase